MRAKRVRLELTLDDAVFLKRVLQDQKSLIRARSVKEGDAPSRVFDHVVTLDEALSEAISTYRAKYPKGGN